MAITRRNTSVAGVGCPCRICMTSSYASMERRMKVAPVQATRATISCANSPFGLLETRTDQETLFFVLAIRTWTMTRRRKRRMTSVASLNPHYDLRSLLSSQGDRPWSAC